MVIIDNQFYEFVPEIITVPTDPNPDEVAPDEVVPDEGTTPDEGAVTPPADIIEESCRSSYSDCICLLYDRETTLKKNELRLKCKYNNRIPPDTVKVIYLLSKLAFYRSQSKSSTRTTFQPIHYPQNRQLQLMQSTHSITLLLQKASHRNNSQFIR